MKKQAARNLRKVNGSEHKYSPPASAYSGALYAAGGVCMNRLCIGTPMTGLVRAEWVYARFGQVIPTNWSHVDIVQFMSSYIPLQYQVPDAENLIAREVVQKDFEWLLFIEHDNVLPPGAFIRINEYMIDGKDPIVGGLYFTKSDPPEPMVYRETGRGYFADWKMGDKVRTNCVPFGTTLIHGSIIKAMWKESPEYVIKDPAGNLQVTRRIFEAPAKSWVDPANGASFSHGGTSDMAWCHRIMTEGFFEKAGWPEHQKMALPFLIDTNLFVRHITTDGVQYPLSIPKRYQPTA